MGHAPNQGGCTEAGQASTRACGARLGLQLMPRVVALGVQRRSPGRVRCGLSGTHGRGSAGSPGRCSWSCRRCGRRRWRPGPCPARGRTGRGAHAREQLAARGSATRGHTPLPPLSRAARPAPHVQQRDGRGSAPPCLRPRVGSLAACMDEEGQWASGAEQAADWHGAPQPLPVGQRRLGDHLVGATVQLA